MSRGGSNVGNPSWFFSQKLREGRTVKEITRSFRDAGGRMGTTAMHAEIRRVRQSLLDHPTVSTLPVHLRPAEQHFAGWKTARPDQYVYQMKVPVWHAGIGTVIERDWSVESSTIISPAKAMQQAMDQITAGVDANPQYGGQRVIGATLVGLYKTI